MADINLKGMGVALITPFKEDESVDYEALARLVDYQLQNGDGRNPEDARRNQRKYSIL